MTGAFGASGRGGMTGGLIAAGAGVGGGTATLFFSPGVASQSGIVVSVNRGALSWAGAGDVAGTGATVGVDAVCGGGV